MLQKLVCILLLAFSSFVALAQSNLDLEAWTGYNPDSWYTRNSFTLLGAPQSVYKETVDPGEGLSSARLETIYWLGATGFGATSDTIEGVLSIPINPDPLYNTYVGLPYSQRPSALNFLYKYAPVATDTGYVRIQLFHWNGSQRIIDGQGLALFGSTVSSWTEHSILINYSTTDTPDSLLLICSSSAGTLFGNFLAFPGSVLEVDSFVLCPEDSTCNTSSICDTAYTYITVFDTIDVFDTTTVFDTVLVFDTLFVTDTIEFIDTIVYFDSIIVIDTNYIYDTVMISVTDTLIIDVSLTGVNPPGNINTIKIYPNPTSGQLIINNGNYLDMSGYRISIINNLGQDVFSSLVTTPEFVISISSLGPVGLYYILIFDGSGNLLENRKLVLE